MGEYRERTTGEVKTQGEWRAVFKNMSLPQVWSSGVCDAMNLDPVLPSPPATTSAYQTSVRDGVEQDSKGNWVEKYVAKDMFADTTVDGKTTTKAEHEKAYQATLDANTAASHRATRDAKLAETDFYALSDVTMSSEMQSFRQSLRDITTHKNWPNLEDADWPTAP
jgi:hypothetical protein|tara:strand:- start:301 stop:798 length:498 start_codon:yes stop_codon:yes gene_type:complete